jgi:hypothetical protein
MSDSDSEELTELQKERVAMDQTNSRIKNAFQEMNDLKRKLYHYELTSTDFKSQDNDWGADMFQDLSNKTKEEIGKNQLVIQELQEKKKNHSTKMKSLQLL